VWGGEGGGRGRGEETLREKRGTGLEGGGRKGGKGRDIVRGYKARTSMVAKAATTVF